MDEARIAAAEIDSTLREDGAGVELVGYQSGVLSLRLHINNDACSECLMPVAVLEEVALKMARRTMPDVVRVSILDPRG